MLKPKFLFLWMCLVTLACSSETMAATIGNGSFETGTFSLWTPIGETCVLSGTSCAATSIITGVSPTDGTRQALLSSSGIASPVPVSILESTPPTGLGLSSGTLTAIATLLGSTPALAIEGSAITQAIIGASGETTTLSFDYDFFTDADPSFLDPLFNDFAFVVLPAGTSTTSSQCKTTLTDIPTGNLVCVLADTFSLLTLTPPGSNLADHHTGYTSFSVDITLPSSGSFLLGFGVVDVGATFETSALQIDDVQVTAITTPIPEPGTVLLLGSGLAGVVLWRRKRTRP